MTVTFHTVVLHLPRSPLGLISESWAVEHWCRACRQRVGTDELIAHAQSHPAIAPEDFPPPPGTGTMTPDMMGTDPTKEASRD